MLKTVTTKNFRKLSDNVFEFTEGLNVVRGLNEGGKSTLLEAIKYALFGVKVCRTSLDDMVTYGRAVNTLEVTCTFEVETMTYTVTRSKSGAECRYDGGTVTGQSEVSNFVARLFGANQATIPKLMMADQNEIRGALSAGDTETAKLIEVLANLKVLDELQDHIKAQLPCGIDTAAQSRLVEAKKNLADLMGAANFASTETLEKAAAEQSGLVSAALVDVARLSNELTPLNTELGRQTLVKEKRDAAVALVKVAEKDADSLQNSMEAVKFPEPPASVDRAPHQQVLDNAKSAKQLASVKAQMAALNAKRPDATWDESWDKLVEASNAATRAVTASQGTIAESATEIRVAKQRLITGSVCGYCAKDVSSLPEVVSKNAATATEIANAEALIKKMHVRLAEASEELEAYNQITAHHQDALALSVAHPQLVGLDTGDLPARLHWTGGPTEIDATAVAAAEAALRAIAAHEQAASQAAGQLSAYKASWEAKVKQVQAMQAALPPPPTADLAALQASLLEVSVRFNEATARRDAAQASLQSANTELARVGNANKLLEIQQASLTKQIEDAESEIDALAFNNALIKRIREVRPLVANHLWGKVLTAVSFYFSKMRGAPSIVSKDGTGFRVDGQTITGLSGSTLDVLGLAIRLALTKTFAPHVGMLILDEPFAAFDAERTEASLAFLSTCGFKQVLLVTHEESSTANADNIVNV